MENGHYGSEDILAPRYGISDNAEINMSPENGSRDIIASKISIICNNTRTA
jgi:hypothetical protein